MWGLMYVWDCPKCGERLDDQIHYNAEIIDTVNDRVEHVNLCDSCGSEVKKQMSAGSDGQPIPVMAEVDDDRMDAFAYNNLDDDPNYERDYIDYGDDELSDDVEDLMDEDDDDEY